MRKRLLLIFILVIALNFTVLLFGCTKEDPNPNGINVTGIEVSSEKEVLLIDEVTTLSAVISPANATNKNLIWGCNFDDIASVDGGMVTALKPGVATISVSSEDGGYSANTVIYVGDAIVDKEYNAEETADFGTKRFNSVSTALSVLDENKEVVVMGGDYNEDINVGKSVILYGVDAPVLKSITMSKDGSELRIRGFEFKSSQYPQGGMATIKGAIDGQLEIVDCKFKIENEAERTGGYAIYASTGTNKISVKGCTIDNYRYGIYAHRTGADFDITNNTFTNLEIGVGVDLKVPNSTPPINVPAIGEIADNTYTEVGTRAQFFYNGENYDGNLDFSDFQT